MRSYVTLAHAGERFTLVPGDLIGRHASCALQICNPRVSEAHAMVSLRS
jgi:hypothetical protein